MNEIKFAKRIENDWVVLKISGRLDTTTAKPGEDEGAKALTEADKLALDLENLEYISSAGLRVLLRLAKMAAAQHKEFCLAGVGGMVLEVLEDSGLDVLFDKVANIDQLAQE